MNLEVNQRKKDKLKKVTLERIWINNLILFHFKIQLLNKTIWLMNNYPMKWN